MTSQLSELSSAEFMQLLKKFGSRIKTLEEQKSKAPKEDPERVKMLRDTIEDQKTKFGEMVKQRDDALGDKGRWEAQVVRLQEERDAAKKQLELVESGDETYGGFVKLISSIVDERMHSGGLSTGSGGSQTLTLDHVKTDILVTNSKRKKSFDTDDIGGRILWLMKTNSNTHFLRDFAQGFQDNAWVATDKMITTALGKMCEKDEELLGKEIKNKQNSYFLSPNVTFVEN